MKRDKEIVKKHLMTHNSLYRQHIETRVQLAPISYYHERTFAASVFLDSSLVTVTFVVHEPFLEYFTRISLVY